MFVLGKACKQQILQCCQFTSSKFNNHLKNQLIIKVTKKYPQRSSYKFKNQLINMLKHWSFCLFVKDLEERLEINKEFAKNKKILIIIVDDFLTITT